MIEGFDVQNDIEIDQYHLEGECVTMAAVYYKYADAAREAKSALSDAQDAVKVITAERNIAIREECASNGIKVTEGIIASRVDCDSQVVEARRAMREAEAVYLRLSAGVSALEIKKSELDNLVKLRCNMMYVDNPMKPSSDIKSDIASERNAATMTPLPKR